ncbi:MAG: glycosyltransferase [Pseudomonadota bacterium]|nr:glycosyltransferase [Pseudomonadota bacterium]
MRASPGVPELSVIIPTLNRGRLFHDSVRQVLGQRFPDFDLWLVDQSDPDQRAANEALVAELGDPRVHYLHLAVKGLPNARNEGLARARGRIVLFLDDDVILLDDRFLDAHVRPYEDPAVGGVTGRIVERSVRPNAKETAAHISAGGRTITNMWGTERRPIESCKGANMSYRRAAIDEVGGFDRRYTGTALLEDTDFSYRIRAAGWTLLYEPACELVHLSAPSGGVRVEDALRGETWRFRNTAYFVLKHRGRRAFPRFLSTFGAIAAARAARWRDPGVVTTLAGAIRAGVEDWRKGPDQALPSV